MDVSELTLFGNQYKQGQITLKSLVTPRESLQQDKLFDEEFQGEKGHLADFMSLRRNSSRSLWLIKDVSSLKVFTLYKQQTVRKAKSFMKALVGRATFKIFCFVSNATSLLSLSFPFFIRTHKRQNLTSLEEKVVQIKISLCNNNNCYINISNTIAFFSQLVFRILSK